MSVLDLGGYERVPNSGIYFIGSFSRRLTVYSQQVRAMTLAHSLLASGRLPPNGTVAIVGGGIAGITAAAALQTLAPDLNGIDVFEAKDSLVHLQSHSGSRFLHPHLYDWPLGGSFDDRANLPILDWTASSAAEVAKELLQLFARFRTGSLQVHRSERVRRVVPRAGGLGGAVITERASQPKVYDAVIAAVGFGYERTGIQSSSYWDVSPLAGTLRVPMAVSDVLISGNGDGGLVDFALATAKANNHEQLIRLFRDDPDFALYADAAKAIEERAQADPCLDLAAVYGAELPIPDRLLLKVNNHLRTDVRVTFHTRESATLRSDTSPVNRLLFTLLASAAARFAPGRVRILSGLELQGDPFEDLVVRIGPSLVMTPHKRFLRFGSDRMRGLQPFARALPSRRRYALDADAQTPRLAPDVRRDLARSRSIVVKKVPAWSDRPGPIASRPVVLASAYPFLSPGTLDWHANLMLGALLHEQVTIPGSMVLKDRRVGRVIERNPELLTSGALVLDLRDTLVSFAQYTHDVLDGGSDDQKRLADRLDEWCPSPLRFSAEQASDEYKSQLEDLANQLATETRAEGVLRARERLEKVPAGMMSRQAAIEAFAGSGVEAVAHYLYSTCGANSLRADVQVPTDLVTKVAELLRPLDVRAVAASWAQDAVRELLSLNSATLAELTGADIAHLREQGLMRITRELLKGTNSWPQDRRIERAAELELARSKVLDRVRDMAATQRIHLTAALGGHTIGAIDPEFVPLREMLAPLIVFVETVQSAVVTRAG